MRFLNDHATCDPSPYCRGHSELDSKLREIAKAFAVVTYVKQVVVRSRGLYLDADGEVQHDVYEELRGPTPEEHEATLMRDCGLIA